MHSQTNRENDWLGCWASEAIIWHVSLNLLESCGCFQWSLMICKCPQKNSLTVVLVKQCDHIRLKLCLCWEMGGHDTAFEAESNNNTGLNHILPRPHPGNIVSFRKLDRMKEYTDIKASSRVQCTLYSPNYWMQPDLVNTQTHSSHQCHHTCIVTHPWKGQSSPFRFHPILIHLPTLAVRDIRAGYPGQL